jgi:hypothetical protein
VMKIAGTDTGEFGDAPMKALRECEAHSAPPIHLSSTRAPSAEPPLK